MSPPREDQSAGQETVHAKTAEVLRLDSNSNGYQQIGRSCAIGVSTVHKYLKRAERRRHLAAARGLMKRG